MTDAATPNPFHVGDTIRLHSGESATVAAASSWGVRCGGVWFNWTNCTLLKAATPAQGAPADRVRVLRLGEEPPPGPTITLAVPPVRLADGETLPRKQEPE